MTVTQFTQLDDAQQAITLLERGTYVAERLYKNFNIYLYQVDNFYVEVYHNIKYNVMQGMSSFDDDEALQPYLESIDITGIYN